MGVKLYIFQKHNCLSDRRIVSVIRNSAILSRSFLSIPPLASNQNILYSQFTIGPMRARHSRIESIFTTPYTVEDFVPDLINLIMILCEIKFWT